MPYTPPNVYYCATFDGIYSELDGVQSVSITRGKQRFQDSIAASQCVIELIPQSTFPANISLGQFIDIRDTNTGTSSAYFVGRITDIQRDYSIPYNTVTGYAPDDRVTITITGGTGALASGYGAITPGTVQDAAYVICVGSMGVANVYSITPQNLTYVPGSIANPIGINVITPASVEPWLETMNKVLNTIQYSIDDSDLGRVPKTYFIPDVYSATYSYPTGQTGINIQFVDDGTTGATKFKYSQIEFLSSVQSSFSQVIIQSSLGDQEIVTGSRPYVGFSYPTAVATSGQATSLGNYILTVNSSANLVPFTISTNSAIQANAADLGKLADCPIGTAITLKFRGGTYQATVSAISADYTPEIANIRLTLTPSLGTPFTLDSTAFGVLDTNRLGFP
jgi:hypothetical protein